MPLHVATTKKKYKRNTTTQMGPDAEPIPKFTGPLEPEDFVKDKRSGNLWHVDIVDVSKTSGKTILICTCNSLLVKHREMVWYLDEVIPFLKKQPSTYVSNTSKEAKAKKAARKSVIEALTAVFCETFSNDAAAE